MSMSPCMSIIHVGDNIPGLATVFTDCREIPLWLKNIPWLKPNDTKYMYLKIKRYSRSGGLVLWSKHIQIITIQLKTELTAPTLG